MRRQFPITLPSNTESNFTYNTIASYNTKLARRLEFPQDENWTVGLSEILYTKTWNNVRKIHEIKLFDKNGDIIDNANMGNQREISNVDIDIVFTDNEQTPADQIQYINIDDFLIEPGYYGSIQALCDHINEKLKNFEKKLTKVPVLKYNPITNRVVLNAGKINNRACFPYLGEEVEDILGLTEYDDVPLYIKFVEIAKSKIAGVFSNKFTKELEEIFKNKKYKGSRTAELNAGCRSIYVYCDIVEHTFVGDTFAQLLRMVEIPNNTAQDDTIVIKYDRPHYIPLQTRIFDTIRVEVKDDTNKVIPFNSGRVVVKLEFKKE